MQDRKGKMGLGILGGNKRRRKWEGKIEKSVLRKEKRAIMMKKYGDGMV